MITLYSCSDSVNKELKIHTSHVSGNLINWNSNIYPLFGCFWFLPTTDKRYLGIKLLDVFSLPKQVVYTGFIKTFLQKKNWINESSETYRVLLFAKTKIIT